jgi:hypothetical protein
MVWKEFLDKLKKVSISSEKKDYSNRFNRFYHLNRKRLIEERRSSYKSKKAKGICVRCNRPALSKIIFCEYHKKKQKGYNLKARDK